MVEQNTGPTTKRNVYFTTQVLMENQVLYNY